MRSLNDGHRFVKNLSITVSQCKLSGLQKAKIIHDFD